MDTSRLQIHLSTDTGFKVAKVTCGGRETDCSHLVGTTFFTSLALDSEATLVFLPMDKGQLEK